MAGEPQSAHTRLTQTLSPDIWRVNFYRFCQLLEQTGDGTLRLGSGGMVDDPVRFRPWPGMGFPASELRAVERNEDHPERPLSVRTTFLGVYGVDSPLPGGYLDDIAQRREGHEALTAFLDIFSHRITTQYYRIWRKYAYPATFEAGGADAISQCLLGLVGLGIPGTAQHVATPVSRFLALLGSMRQPTRNAEGIRALVNLLAPQTRVTVQEYDPVKIPVAQRTGLSRQNRASLSARSVLGKHGYDACSQVRVTLATEEAAEAEGWLPGGQLHTDLLVLMRVYLGWRTDARLQLTIPLRLLPEPRLGNARRTQLGRTGVLGLDAQTAARSDRHITIRTGGYEGLPESPLPPADGGDYRFV
ncbi:type VI secretion system baseplate subunit TssG [Salmonella enterica subsp. enterica]